MAGFKGMYKFEVRKSTGLDTLFKLRIREFDVRNYRKNNILTL